MVCLFQFPREEKGSNYCIVVAPKSNWSPSTTFLSRVRPSSNKLYQTKREKLRSRSSITLPTTVWKFQDFSVIQILCKINWSIFEILKIAVFAILISVNLVHFSLQKL